MKEQSNIPKVGRPRKDASEKIKYQLIAIHQKDYEVFIDKVENSGLKKVEAFHYMVKQFNPAT